MFGAKLRPHKWNSFADFFEAAAVAGRTGNCDSRLMVRAGISEGVPSDGGFVIDEEYAAEMLDVSLESEIVRSRAKVWSMDSHSLHIPGTVIGSHSTNLYGGTIGYWKNEAASMTQAEPKFRAIELTANKLTVYGKASNEWVADKKISSNWLKDNTAGAIGWFLDKEYLKGDGVGKPLGVLNAACTIAVAAETNQPAATINYKNIVKMFARLHPASFKRAVWVCHNSTLPQLLSLSIVVGMGGSHYPVLSERSGRFSMLGRSVVFTEKTEALGTKGDIMLCDFSQYSIGMRKEIRFDMTQMASFATDELDYRCILRTDGQPSWNEALTLLDGVTTVSPFVVLATRT
jgi:HK97 family phage major capsid protein